jgi:hypothetical protein
MLESMMGELMSKDVLYDPLKELKDKVRIRMRVVTAYLTQMSHLPFGFSSLSTLAIWPTHQRHCLAKTGLDMKPSIASSQRSWPPLMTRSLTMVPTQKGQLSRQRCKH